jgi:hypothetical protein
MQEIQVKVEAHLACFDILICNWDQQRKEGYIEVDFGEGRISGFHCHADRLEFALQMIHAFGERCQGLEKDAFTDKMKSLYQHRLFCDLHKDKSPVNYVVIHKMDRLGKQLECIGHRLEVPMRMYKSCIEEEEWQYLQSLARLHQAEVTAAF